MTVERLINQRDLDGVDTGLYYFQSGAAGSVSILRLDPISAVPVPARQNSLMKLNDALVSNAQAVVRERENFKLVSCECIVPQYFDIYQQESVNHLNCSLWIQPLDPPNPEQDPYSIYRFPMPAVNKEYAIDQYVKMETDKDYALFVGIENPTNTRMYSAVSLPPTLAGKKIYLSFNIVVETTRGLDVIFL
jgi:hypothetical protein